MLQRARHLVATGVNFITLLALDDTGKPAYDPTNGAAFAAMNIPVFGCTPDLFPDLMAEAISRRSIASWAANQSLKMCRAK